MSSTGTLAAVACHSAAVVSAFLSCELPPFSGKSELLKADRRSGTGSLAHRELVSEQEVVERKSGSCLFGCKHR